MIDDVDKQVMQGGFETGCVINASDVKSAVRQLQTHKVITLICQIVEIIVLKIGDFAPAGVG